MLIITHRALSVWPGYLADMSVPIDSRLVDTTVNVGRLVSTISGLESQLSRFVQAAEAASLQAKRIREEHSHTFPSTTVPAPGPAPASVARQPSVAHNPFSNPFSCATSTLSTMGTSASAVQLHPH